MVQQEAYRRQSKVFLEEAKKYLEEGNLYQASEKGWGAAAQMVKAVASKRRWNHRHHDLLTEAIGRLYDETNDPEYGVLFSSANSLHSNFYEGRLSQALVALHLTQVGTLVGKLERYLASG